MLVANFIISLKIFKIFSKDRFQELVVFKRLVSQDGRAQNSNVFRAV